MSLSLLAQVVKATALPLDSDSVEIACENCSGVILHGGLDLKIK
jgi:hypothetical protein